MHWNNGSSYRSHKPTGKNFEEHKEHFHDYHNQIQMKNYRKHHNAIKYNHYGIK